MFEKNLTDLVRGIRNNKSNEVHRTRLYDFPSSHEHICYGQLYGRRGIDKHIVQFILISVM